MASHVVRRVAFGIAVVIAILAIAMGDPPLLHPLLGAPGWATMFALEQALHRVSVPLPQQMVFDGAIALATIVNVLTWWLAALVVLRGLARMKRISRSKGQAA